MVFLMGRCTSGAPLWPEGATRRRGAGSPECSRAVRTKRKVAGRTRRRLPRPRLSVLRFWDCAEPSPQNPWLCWSFPAEVGIPPAQPGMTVLVDLEVAAPLCEALDVRGWSAPA